MNNIDCPSAEDLAAFGAGRLDEVAAVTIGEHLDSCTDCQAKLETLTPADDLGALLRRPCPDDEYERESALQRAESLVRAIGRTAIADDPAGQFAAVPDRPMPEQLGQYQLLERLGEGGMGTVYRTMHVNLHREVALKLLPAERMQDRKAVERFQREMQAIGKLDHPRIVRATDAGEIEGRHFLVMELVEGVDLSTLVHRHGPLPVAEACELIRQAAEGLEYAHSKGMIHRDVKPSNIMLARTDDGQVVVKVLDLGLALLNEFHGIGGGELTNTGQMMGTLDYMAPEQGADSHSVDGRADVYSLGATLYKLLCGEAPFGGEQYDTPLKKLRALATQPAPSIGTRRDDLPAELGALVDRMLAMEPADRCASPGEVAQALTEFAEGADLASLLQRSETEPSTHAPVQSELATHGVTSDSQPTASGAASVGRENQQTVIQPKQADLRAPEASPRGIGWITAAAVGLILLTGLIGWISGFFVKVDTPIGTIILEINQPELTGASVFIDDEQKITLSTGTDTEPIEIVADGKRHTLKVTKGGFETFTKEFTVRADEVETITARLEPLESPPNVPAPEVEPGAESDYRSSIPTIGWVVAKDPEGTFSGAGVLVDKDRRLLLTITAIVGDSKFAVVMFPDRSSGMLEVDRYQYLKNVRRLGCRGRLVATDNERGLAFLELDELPPDVDAITLAPESPQPGTPVYSIGHPGGTDALWVHASGNVRAVYPKKLRTSRGGNHSYQAIECLIPGGRGFSGAPLMDADGKLLGIIQAIKKETTDLIYAVSIEDIKHFLDRDETLIPASDDEHSSVDPEAQLVSPPDQLQPRREDVKQKVQNTREYLQRFLDEPTNDC